jgi:hypothetical protein
MISRAKMTMKMLRIVTEEELKIARKTAIEKHHPVSD